MKCSKGTKLAMLMLMSICFLSLWTSVWEERPLAPVSMETFSINRKSLAIQAAIPDSKAIFNTIHTNTDTNGIKKPENSRKTNNTLPLPLPQPLPLSIQSSRTERTSTNMPHRNTSAQTLPLPSRQSRTILVSYMRSGSTFTGDLFQSSSEVMYLYEPLLYTNDADELVKNTPIKSRVIHKFFHDPNPPETLNYTMSTLQCQLSAWNLRYLIGYTYSKSFDDYATCVKNKLAPVDLNACGHDVIKRCQQSRNVISKILRLKMWEVEELLTLDPELKIIHLVRDPRGITMSRRVARYYLNIRTLCDRMTKDATKAIELQKKYPGRILTVRYEDLAISPLNITRQLYQHAGVSWTQEIAEKVQDMTSPRNNSFKETIFGTKRKNSATTAFNWRSQLPFSTASEIQKSCNVMMHLYGYSTFKTSEEKLNLDIPSIKEEYCDKLYKANIFLQPKS